MRTIVQSYYNMKLNAIKTATSLQREIDKSRKEDLKLQKDLYGAVNTSAAPDLTGEHISNEALFGNLFGGGLDTFYSATSSPVGPIPVNPPVQQQLSVPEPTILSSPPVPQEKEPVTVEINKTKEYNPSTIREEIKEDSKEINKAADQPGIIPQPKGQAKTIVNAQGVEVPIYTEGPDDFGDQSASFTNARLSYENIELANNPNVKRIFKFNEKENMGWLTFYDVEKNEEIKGRVS